MPSQVIEVESLKSGLVHLHHKSRIIGNDQVLAGNERQGAIGKTQEMKLWSLGRIHAWYGQFVNLHHCCPK